LCKQAAIKQTGQQARCTPCEEKKRGEKEREKRYIKA
jgi:hypothetical protein